MSRPGTQEAKRRRRAIPTPHQSPFLGAGCVLLSLAWVAACLVWVVSLQQFGAIGLALPAIIVLVLKLAHVLWERALIFRVESEWAPRGVRCLIVYSDSPVWREHIHTSWFPRLSAMSETLNWSDRSQWGKTLAVLVFKHFCGESRNFNPAVVVFRGNRPPLVFRFYYAFHESQDR